MSLLTPLYVAAMAAVALPILFHLLRRTPTKRQTFSSLMFLSPTPPRFTRRSRVSNWLLLLLRAAVLALLALAFGRPFFERDVAVAAGGPVGRRVAILVDTSASMRREDLWQQAKAHAEDLLRETGPADTVALSFFDRTSRAAVSAEQSNQFDPERRTAAVRAALEATTPTWQATAIGDAVAEAAERLAADDMPGRGAVGLRTLVLISDLQQGGRPESLQHHAWPENVRLDIRAVTAKSPANAGLQAVRPSPETPAADQRLRVRIGNDAGATAEQFTLRWADANGPIAAAKPQPVYVAPGRGQVVRVDAPPSGSAADRLLLSGDAHAFDDTLYFAPRRQQLVRVVYAGADAPDDPKGLQFYLRTALGETPQRKVEFGVPSPGKLADPAFADASLYVIGRPLDPTSRDALRQRLNDGGDVLYVAQPPGLGQAAAMEDVAGLTRNPKWQAVEAEGGFALLARLDTTHPACTP